MKKILIAILVIAVLMTTNHFTHQWFRWAVLGIVERPLILGYHYLGNIQGRITSLFRVENIIKESQILREENRWLKAQNLKISELMIENDFLREGLGVAKKRGYQLEMVKIFSFNADGLYRTALIDKGADKSIKVGQPVIFSGDILLGVVKEIYPSNALIFLTTDPRVALNVRVQDSAVSGRTRGALEQGLALELVTNQEEIKEGQVVITSGLDDLPSLLVVGKVSSVQTKSGDLFKTVKIDPEFNNLLLENVFVLKN